jgi:hypothetical protein
MGRAHAIPELTQGTTALSVARRADWCQHALGSIAVVMPRTRNVSDGRREAPLQGLPEEARDEASRLLFFAWQVTDLESKTIACEAPHREANSAWERRGCRQVEAGNTGRLCHDRR